MALVLLLVCVVPVVEGYSSGLVMDSCEGLKPLHSGLNPQTKPSPFTLMTDQSNYQPGQDIKVWLRAPASTPFIGFLLQAREVGASSPVGSFAVASGACQLIPCSQRPASAVSQTSESSKNNIEVRWSPETSGRVKAVQFHASFVQDYRTFWVDITSPVVTLNLNSTAGFDSYQWTPPVTTQKNTIQPVPIFRNISSAGCGVTKVCFSQPVGCDPSFRADCWFMSAQMLSAAGPGFHYEITGPSDGYVSLGFSDDQMMGNDDIYICGKGSDGQLLVQHAFSVGRTVPQNIPLGNVSDVNTSLQDGVISCSFNSMNPISTQKTFGFNQTYYLMFAHGPSRNGQIQFHSSTFISTDKIDISKPVLVQKAGWPNIIKAHGALMLTAWMTTGPVGMAVARFLRGVFKGQTLCGKDTWFVIHVAVMSLTVAATLISFILSFSHVKAWSGGVHPVLGCLVMILSVFQSTAALVRCGPQHPLRFVFNWSHAINGVIIKALAVAAIFTGLKVMDSTSNQWLMKVMGGFVGWETSFYLLLEVRKRRSNDPSEPSTSKKIRAHLWLLTLFCVGNLSFLVSLLVGIGMS